MDANDAESLWLVNETDTIFIKDGIEIIESMANSHGIEGYKYTVKSVTKFKEIKGSRKIHLLDVTRSDGKDKIILIDGDLYLDLITLCEFDDSIPRNQNRKDLIDKNFYHIFEPPSDENNFIPSDLNYSSVIYTSEETVWNAISGCFLKDSSDTFIQLCVYRVETDGVNEDVVGYIIEMGGVDKTNGAKNPDGGLVIMMKGRDISHSEFEVFRD